MRAVWVARRFWRILSETKCLGAGLRSSRVARCVMWALDVRQGNVRKGVSAATMITRSRFWGKPKSSSFKIL